MDYCCLYVRQGIIAIFFVYFVVSHALLILMALQFCGIKNSTKISNKIFFMIILIS